jgi:hypothetical protein
LAARKIMVIRHAEKPDDEGTISGVDVQGGQNPEELTVQGWQRAGALVRFFAPTTGHFADPRIETPSVIFAGAVAPHSKSLRPQRTVSPLADLLGRNRLRLEFSEGQEGLLINAAIAAGDVVLISWHHEAIPAIKDVILGNQSQPRKWAKDRFDLVWVFTRSAGEWQFEQVPQLLLAGDKSNLIT